MAFALVDFRIYARGTGTLVRALFPQQALSCEVFHNDEVDQLSYIECIQI